MIYQLYIGAMELEHKEREAFVRSQCDDESILTKVLSLLSTDKLEFTLSDQVVKESDLYKQQNTAKLGDIISVYQLTESLGQGGMGTVFKAQRIDDRFEQTVAIKIISPLLYSFFDSNKLVSEADFMAKLNHNNICSVYDVGTTEDGLHYIVMEYLDGKEISSFFGEQSIALNEKLEIFSTLCDAVNYAHQMQVIHGDLKPANVLINRNSQIKVLDFGISQVIHTPYSSSEEGEELQFHGISKGYASPELFNGEKPSVYSDIYALGNILFSLVEQSKPSNQSYSREIDAIIKKATAFSPIERYASVSELKQDINLLTNGYVVSAYQCSNIYKLKKFVFNRHPISVFVGVIFTICLSALATNLVIQYQNLDYEKQQTDLMLERFSLVLDLDFDRKANIELNLANNYQSRGEDEKAAVLYNKIINRFDKLNNTDIAFEAGSELINLLFNSKQIDLIAPTLAPLRNKLTFISDSILPQSATQAMFYQALIKKTYHRDENDINEAFVFHTKLLQEIKKTYWQELSNNKKSQVNYYLAKVKGREVPSQINDPIYYQKNEINYISSLFNRFQSTVIEYFSLEDKLLLDAKDIRDFLEAKPVIFSVTHVNEAESEGENKVIFSQGITRFAEMKGIYKVSDNLLTFNFGEGDEFEHFIYLSSTLALSVPMQEGDLILLTHDLLIHDNKYQTWNKEELVGKRWFHIYDSSLNKKDEISPSLMEIKFTKSHAELNINNQSKVVPWDINKEGLLELYLSKGDRSALQIDKVRADSEMVITKNQRTGVFSLFMEDEKLARQIFNNWKSLL